MKRGGHGVPWIVARRLAALGASALLVGALTTAAPRTAVATGIESVTEYPVPGGNPWGTAFDGSGRVWVAMPGCDPSPTCPGSTPAGKLALFDPAARSWTTVVSLPVGYGQPLFVAVDHAGKVWFTMPTTNAIGLYNPADATVRRWAASTAGTSYTIHFRAVGSTLTANVWAASGSEPSTWMLTATDNTFASGFTGMRILTNTGTATVTSFQAKSL
jgi:streptogramin lyase